jgi:hypothetical protein
MLKILLFSTSKTGRRDSGRLWGGSVAAEVCCSTCLDFAIENTFYSAADLRFAEQNMLDARGRRKGRRRRRVWSLSRARALSLSGQTRGEGMERGRVGERDDDQGERDDVTM